MKKIFIFLFILFTPITAYSSEQNLLNLYKTIDYCNDASILINRSTAFILSKQEELQLIEFYTNAYDYVQKIDLDYMNKKYPQLGDNILILQDGIQGILNSFKIFDVQLSIDSQIKIDVWGKWYSENSAKIHELFSTDNSQAMSLYLKIAICIFILSEIFVLNAFWEQRVLLELERQVNVPLREFLLPEWYKFTNLLRLTSVLSLVYIAYAWTWYIAIGAYIFFFIISIIIPAPKSKYDKALHLTESFLEVHK